MRRVDYWWRLGGTGAAIAFIFFGGGVLAAALLPLLILAPGSRREHTRSAISASFRFYVTALQRFGIISLQTEGLDKLEAAGGRLVVANHPSLLDVVLLMALIPNAQCIIKHELWNHRFLGPLMRLAGYIRNDMEAEALVEACKDALALGNCLIIFPEGTRSVPGNPPRFQRGFANLATLTRARIQPVIITCDPPILFKGEPWWRIPPHKPLFRLVVDDCLDATAYYGLPYRSLAARKLARSLEKYYTEKLRHV